MAPESRKPGAKPAQGASRAWEALTPALSEWILEAVSSMGFSRMTPVQASTIPLFMGNKDVVVEAVTGSGKTLAFIVPLVEKLLRLEEPIKKHHIGGIILSPTRELAIQIHSVLLNLLAFHAPSAAALRPPDTTDDISMSGVAAAQTLPPASSKALKILPQLLLGGSSTTPQQDLSHFLIHSPNLLIATPGRLLELLSSPHVHCPQSSFEVLVLDEADRLLDMGFKEDLTRILQRLPKQRRTGLFSASMTEGVDQLVRVGLRNPIRIAVKVRGVSGIEGTATEELRVPASLQLTYLATTAHHKLPALLHLLGSLNPQPHRSILYLSTCAAVDYFSNVLPLLLKSIKTSSTTQPYSLIPLHGKQLPNHRTRNFTAFVSSPTPAILLTTDLAARGLDIPQVDLTVQLDPPSDPATFMHRAGRAGRAGRKGVGVVFLLEGREADEYPSFLAVRKTPVRNLLSIAPFSTTPELTTGFSPEALAVTAANVTAKLRKQVRADRTLHDKAQEMAEDVN